MSDAPIPKEKPPVRFYEYWCPACRHDRCAMTIKECFYCMHYSQKLFEKRQAVGDRDATLDRAEIEEVMNAFREQ